MKDVLYHGRRSAQIERDGLTLTVTEEGGHLAELLHQASGINPLWLPSWPSVEPSQYSHDRYPEYGGGPDAQLVAGILGHNVCLDLFGGPSPEEAAAGIPVHGEAPVAPYQLAGDDTSISLSTVLPAAQLGFERRLDLVGNGVVHFTETVTNHSATDRPIAWTQHVTLGAPFLERGVTRFLLSADKSRVFENNFNDGLGQQLPGADFRWPLCPRKDGGTDNLTTFTTET